MRAEDLGRRIASTSAWAALDFGTTFLAGFVLAALFVSQLGATAYGIYLLVLLVSAPGLLSLTDLGMGGVVVTFVARYRAEESPELGRLITFATRYFLALAVLVPAVTSIAILALQDQIFPALAREGVALEVVYFIVLLQSVSLCTLLLEYLLSGLFDYRPIQLSSITMQLLRLLGAALLIGAQANLAAIVAWFTACAALRAVFLGGWLSVRYGALLRRADVGWPAARVWIRYSRSLLARSAAGLVFNFSDRLLISALLPVVRLAQYDIAAKPANMIRALISIATSAVVTASATAAGLGMSESLRALYLRAGRLATIAIIPPIAFLLVNMEDFLVLWVGPTFVGLTSIGQLFLLSFALTMVPAIGDAMLLGMGEAQRTVKVTWVAVAINLAISAALVLPLGILGVVLGTVIGAFVSDVSLTRVHLRTLDIPLPHLVREVILPASLVAAVSLAAVLGVALVAPPVTWVGFIVSGAASAGLAYALALVALPREDQTIVLSAVAGVARGWGKLRSGGGDGRGVRPEPRPRQDGDS